jgi:hypothetical protein
LRLRWFAGRTRSKEVASKVSVVDEMFSERTPTWIELQSVVRMAVAEKITSLSADNLRRNYPGLVVKLSPRRDGMRLRDVLAIANGTARQG